jgi:hypothetical protein
VSAGFVPPFARVVSLSRFAMRTPFRVQPPDE